MGKRQSEDLVNDNCPKRDYSQEFKKANESDLMH